MPAVRRAGSGGQVPALSRRAPLGVERLEPCQCPVDQIRGGGGAMNSWQTGVLRGRGDEQCQ